MLPGEIMVDNSGHSDKKTTFDYEYPLPSTACEESKKIDDALDLKNIISELLGKPVNKRRKKEPESID